MNDPHPHTELLRHELPLAHPLRRRSINDTDPREVALRELSSCLDDLDWVVGEAASAAGRTWRGDDAHRTRTVAAVRDVADRAEQLLEICARYEELLRNLPPELPDE